MKPTVMKNNIRMQPSPARRGFTLIELLVVISIIGVLAAFTLGAVSVVAKKKYINNAQSEMGMIQAALERYKAAYGFYPPSNPKFLLPTNAPGFTFTSPLYFELQGVTTSVVNNGTNYTTLDGMNSVLAQNINGSFGVDGLVNCSKGSGDDAISAKNFLPNLKANQIGIATNPAATPGVAILITSVGGPDASYQPLGAPALNPWRYNSINPTNNPGGYDLYVQLSIGHKMYLVCNWSKQVPVNNPLP